MHTHTQCQLLRHRKRARARARMGKRDRERIGSVTVSRMKSSKNGEGFCVLTTVKVLYNKCY